MTTNLRRRIDKLSTKFCPTNRRTFTLEELCRLYWRLDKRGFQGLVREAPIYGCLVDSFEREDAAPKGTMPRIHHLQGGRSLRRRITR